MNIKKRIISCSLAAATILSSIGATGITASAAEVQKMATTSSNSKYFGQISGATGKVVDKTKGIVGIQVNTSKIPQSLKYNNLYLIAYKATYKNGKYSCQTNNNKVIEAARTTISINGYNTAYIDTTDISLDGLNKLDYNQYYKIVFGVKVGNTMYKSSNNSSGIYAKTPKNPKVIDNGSEDNSKATTPTLTITSSNKTLNGKNDSTGTVYLNAKTGTSTSDTYYLYAQKQGTTNKINLTQYWKDDNYIMKGGNGNVNGNDWIHLPENGNYNLFVVSRSNGKQSKSVQITVTNKGKIESKDVIDFSLQNPYNNTLDGTNTIYFNLSKKQGAYEYYDLIASNGTTTKTLSEEWNPKYMKAGTPNINSDDWQYLSNGKWTLYAKGRSSGCTSGTIEITVSGHSTGLDSGLTKNTNIDNWIATQKKKVGQYAGGQCVGYVQNYIASICGLSKYWLCGCPNDFNGNDLLKNTAQYSGNDWNYDTAGIRGSRILNGFNPKQTKIKKGDVLIQYEYTDKTGNCGHVVIAASDEDASGYFDVLDANWDWDHAIHFTAKSVYWDNTYKYNYNYAFRPR